MIRWKSLLSAIAFVLLGSLAGAQTTNTVPVPSSPKRYISVGTSNDESQVKATPGVLVGISARNTNASTDAFIKCTNLTAANTTPGSSAVFYEFIIPHAAGYIENDINIRFSVALTCYLTTQAADSGTATVAANEVSYNLKYR